jgi:hypothetical protein
MSNTIVNPPTEDSRIFCPFGDVAAPDDSIEVLIRRAKQTAVPWIIEGLWQVPRPRTEMTDLDVGNRLGVMYPTSNLPRNLAVSEENLIKQFRQCPTLKGKMDFIESWMRWGRMDLLTWDTINPILASIGDPNSEITTSKFLDAVAQLPHKGIVVVRHDGKLSRDSVLRASNQRVRGSNRLVEDASLVIHLQRVNKASHNLGEEPFR